MSAFAKFMKLFSMAGGVRSIRNPITGGIEKLVGVVGLKFGRFAPITPLSLALSADAPTITSNATATISGGSVIGRDNAALTYYSNAGIGEFQGWLTYNGGSLMQVEFMTNSAAFEIGIIQFSTQMRIFVDGKLASAAISTNSSGAEIFYKLAFADRRQRRITVVGVNMPFQFVVLSAGDAIWPAKDDIPIACFAGDSYTFGNGGTGGPALSYAMLCGFALGYRVIPDAVGGTGWNTTGSNSPLTRLGTIGANALVKRVSAANTAITPELHVVAYGFNDAGGNMTTLSAAASAYIAASAVKPVVIGPWTPAGETADLILVKNALSSVAGSTGCKFIDISTFVTSGNKASLIDVDNVHPVLHGHDYLAQRIASEIRTMAIA